MTLQTETLHTEQQNARRTFVTPRARFANWFWHGLTGLVFAGTIALLFMPPGGF